MGVSVGLSGGRGRKNIKEAEVVDVMLKSRDAASLTTDGAFGGLQISALLH